MCLNQFLATRVCNHIDSIVLINHIIHICKVNCNTRDKYKYSFYTYFNTPPTLLLSRFPAVLEMKTQTREGCGENYH